jgi:hypothetical protein
MDRRDWILLVTSCADDGGLTPVQLQKSLFLLGQKIPSVTNYAEYYNFIAYDYGPFCIDIYRDAELLASEGYININRIAGQRFEEYLITVKGIKLVEEIKKQIPENLYQYICEIIKWVKSLTFPQLIKAIYSEYPDFSKNSIFK